VPTVGRVGGPGLALAPVFTAGMSELEAIEVATATAPETLGPQGPRSGQLRIGYDADLIARDGDPFGDPSIWGDADPVTHVWRAGRRVK
jgi:imidazolonepropionase-like amidohydrolase